MTKKIDGIFDVKEHGNHVGLYFNLELCNRKLKNAFQIPNEAWDSFVKNRRDELNELQNNNIQTEGNDIPIYEVVIQDINSYTIAEFEDIKNAVII